MSPLRPRVKHAAALGALVVVLFSLGLCLCPAAAADAPRSSHCDSRGAEAGLRADCCHPQPEAASSLVPRPAAPQGSAASAALELLVAPQRNAAKAALPSPAILSPPPLLIPLRS